MNITKMSLFGKRYRQFYMVLAAVIVISVLGSRFSDPHQSKVENFILSSSELKRSIGAIERLELVETLNKKNNGDHENVRKPNQKLYKFDAHGITGTRHVLVSVQVSSTGRVDSIRIEKIE